MQHIQSLLPGKETLLKIVDYYYDCMLYWAGGLYHGPSFRNKLLEAYGSGSALDLQTLDWRWTALLCTSSLYTFRRVSLDMSGALHEVISALRSFLEVRGSL